MNELGAILFGLLALGGVSLLALVFPILSFVRASRARRLAEQANDRVGSLSRAVNELMREVDHLRADVARLQAPGAADTATANEPDATAAQAADAPGVTPAANAPAPSAVPGDAEPAADAATPAADAVAGPEPTTTSAPHDAPPPPVPPRPIETGPWTPPGAHHAPTFEQRIGQRWLLYLGVAAVVLGASYLLKYAFDNEWITPAMRVFLGVLGGAVLVAAGDRVARRDVPLFGHGLVGAGLAIVYVSLYAALHLYDLLDPATTSLGMMATTAVGAWMATRHGSQVLAIIAAVGAYATPYLIASDTRSPVPLFSYLCVLAAGTWWLVRIHEWPMLAIVSFIATALTTSGWMVARYRDAHYLIVEAFFAVLAAIFVAIAVDLHRRATETAARATSAGALCALGAFLLGVVGPIGFHLASLAVLAPHTQALLIYFITITLAGLLLAGDGDRPWIRVAAWVSVMPPFMGWLVAHPQARGALVTVLAIYGLHLIAELRSLWHDRARLRVPDGLLLHLNALSLLLGLLVVTDSPDPGVMASVALGLAAWHAVLALAVRGRHDFAPWHYVALVAAFVAAAIALRYDGPMIAMGWAVEGALLVWLGLRQALPWMRWGGWVLFLVALASAVTAYGSGPAADMTPFANMHAAAMFVITGLLFWLASRYHAGSEPPARGTAPAVTACIITACVLLLATSTEEVNGIFGARAWAAQVEQGPMAAGTVDFARLATISVLWATYALGLVLVGVMKRYRPIRYLAIAIFAVTILKVVFVDLAALDTLYRILSVMGLGVLLLGASYLYQRFLADDEGDGPGQGPPTGSTRPD